LKSNTAGYVETDALNNGNGAPVAFIGKIAIKVDAVHDPNLGEIRHQTSNHQSVGNAYVHLTRTLFISS
jgi:hypothetical protein